MLNPEAKCSVYAESHGKPKLNDLISIKLTAELLDGLKNGDLEFKACEMESFICSRSKTYKLSGSSCNPTQCLMGEDNRDKGAFCLGTAVKSSLVADEVPGQIEWDSVPVYSTDGISSKETLESIMRRSFCSKLEFERYWKEYGGVEIDGNACVLTDDLAYKIGIELNSAIFSEGSTDFEIIHAATTREFPADVYQAIYKRFWPGDGLPQWVGLQMLPKLSGQDVDTFISRWKRDLLGVEVSISLLAGHCIQLGEKVVYIDRNILSKDPKKRLEYLFSLKSEWVFNEVVPFYSDLTDTSDRRGTEGFLKSFSKVVSTRDPNSKGKIIKRVQLLK